MLVPVTAVVVHRCAALDLSSRGRTVAVGPPRARWCELRSRGRRERRAALPASRWCRGRHSCPPARGRRSRRWWLLRRPAPARPGSPRAGPAGRPLSSPCARPPARPFGSAPAAAPGRSLRPVRRQGTSPGCGHRAARWRRRSSDRTTGPAPSARPGTRRDRTPVLPDPRDARDRCAAGAGASRRSWSRPAGCRSPPPSRSRSRRAHGAAPPPRRRLACRSRAPRDARGSAPSRSAPERAAPERARGPASARSARVRAPPPSPPPRAAPGAPGVRRVPSRRGPARRSRRPRDGSGRRHRPGPGPCRGGRGGRLSRRRCPGRGRAGTAWLSG